MFDLRTFLIVPIALLLFYIVYNNPEDANLWKRKEIWFRRSYTKTLLVSVLVLIFAAFFFPALQVFIGNFLPLVINHGQTSQGSATQKAIETAGLTVGLVLSGAFAAIIGFIEEYIFRGIFLEFFKEKYSKIVAVLISSSLFGVYHLAEIGFGFGMAVYAFVTGAIFAAIYLKIGLSGAAIVHSGTNFVFTVAILF